MVLCFKFCIIVAFSLSLVIYVDGLFVVSFKFIFVRSFTLVLLSLLCKPFKFLYVSCVCLKPLSSFFFFSTLPFLSYFSSCISSFFYFLLLIIPTSPPAHFLCPVPPRQTCPITRTITIKAKLWIKGMIFPQWPMPWRGWVLLHPSQPCPAAQDLLPVCMIALCSAQAVKKPLRGLRWALENLQTLSKTKHLPAFNIFFLIDRSNNLTGTKLDFFVLFFYFPYITLIP